MAKRMSDKQFFAIVYRYGETSYTDWSQLKTYLVSNNNNRAAGTTDTDQFKKDLTQSMIRGQGMYSLKPDDAESSLLAICDAASPDGDGSQGHGNKFVVFEVLDANPVGEVNAAAVDVRRMLALILDVLVDIHTAASIDPRR